MSSSTVIRETWQRQSCQVTNQVSFSIEILNDQEKAGTNQFPYKWLSKHISYLQGKAGYNLDDCDGIKS